jgi:hypothetical protein
MANPGEGTNCYKIWQAISTDKFIKGTDIDIIAKQNNGGESVPNYSTHLHDLNKRGLIKTKKIHGSNYYKRLNSTDKPIISTEKKPTHSNLVLNYCKKNIGKTVSGKILINYFQINSTSFYEYLNKLYELGALEIVQGITPKLFRIKPGIVNFNKIGSPNRIKTDKNKKTSNNSQLDLLVPSPIELETITPENQIAVDIANMSITQIFSDYTKTKQENFMLKQGMETIAHVLFQCGVLNDEDS